MKFKAGDYVKIINGSSFQKHLIGCIGIVDIVPNGELTFYHLNIINYKQVWLGECCYSDDELKLIKDKDEVMVELL